jgi:hypothetical protein
MPSSPPPLWDGYDDAGEDKLIALLDGKARAAHDADDPTVSDGVARSLAEAIANHESIKKELRDPSYRPDLHSLADDIRAGSWRPK